MEIPEHFKEELERRLEEKRKAKEEEARREKAYKEHLKRKTEEENHKIEIMLGKEYLQVKLEKENSKLRMELGICERIFDWKNEFLLTQEGLTLVGRYKDLAIYGEGWNSDVYHSICSHVYVSGNAFLYVTYREGYNSWPRLVGELNQPEDMAFYLKKGYASRLLESLENGKVFDYILKFNK